MDLMVLLASLLMLTGACCLGLVAYRLDRRLKHLLPSGLARWWDAQPPPASGDVADHIRFYLPRLMPAHWQSQLHSDRGVMLLGRLHLFAGLAFWLTMIGLTLLALGVAPGPR
jgi:hypothetical protein